MMQKTSFLVLLLKGFVSLHRTGQLQLLGHQWWGHHFSLVAQSCLTFCDLMTAACQASLSHHQLPELAHVHWLNDGIQPSHPLSSPSPPAFNLSQHWGLFQWVSSSHQVAKVLEFQFSISPSNEYSGLISFGIDWLYLLAVQGTLKSVLQHHSSKVSILRCSGFFLIRYTYISALLELPPIFFPIPLL